MGALYEDVEKFFGDIFAAYGRIVARYPIPFVAAPVLVCCVMALGVINVTYEYDLERLYAPIDSQAMKDRLLIQKLYGGHAHEDYFPYQEIGRPAFVTLVAVPSEGDALTIEGLAEMATLVEYIRSNVTSQVDHHVVTYSDTCARRKGKCIVEGIVTLKVLMECYAERLHPAHQNRLERNVPDIELDKNYNMTFKPSHCVLPKKLKLQFNLKNANDSHSVPWQEAFIREMGSYIRSVHHIQIAFRASQSLDILLKTSQGYDSKLFAVTVVIMFVYVTALSSGGDWVSTHVLMAHMALVATLMSIVAAFGTIAFIGVPLVKMCTVVPFMVLGLGVDHMLLLLTAWRSTNTRSTIEERTAEMFRACAISTTIMSLTDLLVFCIGSASPFRSVRYTCAASGLSLLICYINQLTFFGGCLVLNARRIAASRHCVTCLPTKSRQELEEDQASRIKVLCCSGSPPRKSSDSPLCRKCPRSLLTKDFLRGITKGIVFLIYIAYIGFGFIGFSRLQVGFRNEDIVPANSHLSNYHQVEEKYFENDGPSVMFVIYKSVAYDRPDVRNRIYSILNAALAHRYVDSSRHIMWLDEYVPHLSHVTNDSYGKPEFAKYIDNDFYSRFPQFKGDINVNHEKHIITSSRFYVFSKLTQNATAERSLLMGLRRLAHNTTLPILVYSTSFIFCEHHVNILKNTLLTVAVTIISMLLIALMFIPHPVAVTCVTVSMISVVLGMLGSLYWLRLTLNAVQTLQLLIGVGLCLNFTTHICHSFMAATGQSRNERVSVALEKVGGTLIYGGLAYFLGLSMLMFGSTYLFTSFVKCLTVAVVVGLLHATVLLPVLLSFLGPRRTCKPRMYVNMSPDTPTFDPEPRLSNSAIPGAKGRRSLKHSPRRDSMAPRKSLVSIRDCREALQEELEPVELDVSKLKLKLKNPQEMLKSNNQDEVVTSMDMPPEYPAPPPPIDDATEAETEPETDTECKATSPLQLDLKPIDL